MEDAGTVVEDATALIPGTKLKARGPLLITHWGMSGPAEISTGTRITTLSELDGYDFIAVTTGGSPKPEGLQWLASLGHEITPPVPSLFTFRINDERLQSLMGTVVEDATALIPGTKLKARGPLLITHWGMSGPAHPETLQLWSPTSGGTRLSTISGHQLAQQSR